MNFKYAKLKEVGLLEQQAHEGKPHGYIQWKGIDV